MTKLKDGLLIVVEGIDGCGKTTFIKNLKTKLDEHSFEYLLTKEPGGSSIGQLIRDIVLTPRTPKVCSKAEYLLFAADRAQHSEQVILPALDEKKIVVSDRMGDSSIVYQGYGRGLDIPTIKKINNWAMNERQPDIIFYLDLDVATAFKRVFARAEPLTSFEEEKEDFMQLAKNGFDELFQNRDNVLKLDANEPSEQLAQRAIDFILKQINHEQ
ncbi:dTMP kinase [bacterium]|jgi:dTMP kinase|nr:dTMP kinase [bacterium]MBT5014953.1 dTMP kinase [bacterium]